MEDKSWISCLAIIALTMLESVALLKGLDGALFGLIVAAVAGLAGYEIRKATE